MKTRYSSTGLARKKTTGGVVDTGALNVHVNTVYYRLDRIKALLGDRLSDPRRAVDLQVALLAHRLLV